MSDRSASPRRNRIEDRVRSPRDSPRDRSRSRSRSRARDFSRSPVRRRSPDRSLSRDRGHERERSRERHRSRSRSRAAAGDWRRTLDGLIDRGDIRSNDLDRYTMEALEGLSDDLAASAIARFAEANFSRISNKSGFLMGIIRRVQQDGPDGGQADLDMLPRSVRYRLRDLIDEGRLHKDDMDARMCRALADLPSDLGLEAVDKFSMASLDTVRSKTGFMMGIIKRIEQDRMSTRAYGGAAAWGGGPAPAYGGYGASRGFERDYRHGPR